jgi:hypothetical protein
MKIIMDQIAALRRIDASLALDGRATLLTNLFSTKSLFVTDVAHTPKSGRRSSCVSTVSLAEIVSTH